MSPPSHAEVASLARQYGRHVYLAAYRVLGRHASAEDVQQDVFVKLLQSPPHQVSSWPAWLATAATRAAIDRLRRQQRRQRLLPHWAQHRLDSAEPEPDAHTEQGERAQRLRQALARLKPAEAECFTLRCVQGLEIDAIARATGMSRNHVSVTLHRARHALEAALAPENRHDH
nr:RNA polymerase sigma factor [Oleiagrimonas sp. C23AA]